MWDDVAMYLDTTGTRRVRIIRSTEHGWFTFEEDYFSDDPLELCWCMKGAESFPICDTQETALREARGRIPWLEEVMQPLGERF